jgi:chromosome segregation ATPase
MKALKLALVILSAAALGAAAAAAVTRNFYGKRLSANESADRRAMAQQQDAVAKLEQAQEGLKTLLAQDQKLQESLEKELAAEKKLFAELQQRYAGLTSENKSLVKKVMAYGVQEKKERELKAQLKKSLEDNRQENEALRRQMAELEKKVKSQAAVYDSSQSMAKILTETADPGARLTELENWVTWLKTKDELNRTEMEKRQRTIQSLQDKTQKMEEKLSVALEQFKEMERESALLRERNIALQIERENLLNDLNGARKELGQLQEKLSQIGELLLSQSAAAPGQDGVPRKVDVEFLNSVGAGGAKK